MSRDGPLAAVGVGRLESLHRRQDCVGVDVADRLVEAVARQVDAHPAGHEHQRALRVAVGEVLGVLGAGLLVGGGGDHRGEVEDLRRVGISSGEFEFTSDGVTVSRRIALVGARGEDGLGVLGGEPHPARRRPGLEDHRGALRRRLGLHCGLSCANLTAILLVIGVMDLRAMAVVTAAITAERLAPTGEPAARVIGAAPSRQGSS